jgi:hypothetical protein
MTPKPERPKPVTKMIGDIAKARECSETQAIEYMLTVATGRLLALGRYGKSLPEGKDSKGVLTRKKKSAPRSKSIKVSE